MISRMTAERPRGQVVRAAVMVQKVAVKRKFQAGLCHATTGKLSINPAVNGYLFRIREG